MKKGTFTVPVAGKYAIIIDPKSISPFIFYLDMKENDTIEFEKDDDREAIISFIDSPEERLFVRHHMADLMPGK